MTKKILNVIPEKCTGCRTCELMCSFKHEEEFNPIKSRINTVLFLEDAFYLPVACQQCDDAPCVRVCPSGALYKDEEIKANAIDVKKCIGCRMCILACPFGCINVIDGKASKCDLCGGEPECVKFCPNEALQFSTFEINVFDRKRNLAAKIIETYRVGSGE